MLGVVVFFSYISLIVFASSTYFLSVISSLTFCLFLSIISLLRASIVMSVSMIAGMKMFLQKVDQSFSSFLRTGFCENNLNVTILTLQKVALVWIFWVLHSITSDTLPYILCLNISIISNRDICTKFDTYIACARMSMSCLYGVYFASTSTPPVVVLRVTSKLLQAG